MSERRASAHYIITEQVSDNDIVEIFGTFPSIEAGMKWLREVYIPEWVAAYEADTGFKADVGFFGNGASDGATCHRWIVRNVLQHEKTEG